ncbi:MAG: FKBP-type peptidyl-prolyl cis-trans isomerase [Solirubrobacteraceae bacterium]
MKSTVSISASGGRSRLAAIPVALLTAALIAGCGSSSSKSSIGVGNENPNAAAEVAQLEGKESPGTPKSGPLSTEPKVTPPSGPAPAKLETRELVKGSGAEAKQGETITVNYVGELYKTGKVFNSTWKETKEPAKFTLAKGSVIEGWVKGIAGMKIGGRRELIIPAEEAYKKEGRLPQIPKSEALVFVVDLLGV